MKSTPPLTKYVENRVLKNIQYHLREAYSAAICSNGPHSDPDQHIKMWESFNRFAKKVMYPKR